MKIHTISNNDYIVCEICKKRLEKMDGRHTKIHNITFKEYVLKYPNVATITQIRFDKEVKDNLKRKKIKESINNQTKFIKCCNPECVQIDELFEVNINVSSRFTCCNKCKLSGYINPKIQEKYQKQKQGMIKKYKVTNPSYLNQTIQKRKETINLNKDKNPNYYKEIVEKRIESIEKEYGKNWRGVLNQISRKAMFEKYGEEFALRIDKFMENNIQTNLLKRGVKFAFEDNDVKKKIIKTNLKKSEGKYKHVMDFPENKKKVSDKQIENWKNPDIRKKYEEGQKQNFILKLKKYLQILKLELIDEYQNAHFHHTWKCLKCNYIFKQNWNAIQVGYSCPNCRPHISKEDKYISEKEVANFVMGLGFKITRGNRHLIKPLELDILIDSKKLAIEYCGLYFHCEQTLEKYSRKCIDNPALYHLYKLEYCLKKGYGLITIFEDEWIFKKDIVKSRIKQILNVNNDLERIHARKCEIREIDPKIKNEFLDEFHIQGKDASKIKLGAFHNNELISVMTFSKGNISKGSKPKEGVWELNRFCSNSNYHIPGIAGKLLSYFKKNFEWEEIFSYADRRWSQGNLYYQLGFELEKITKPNYWYADLNNLKRHHRFNLRKRPDEPKDISEMVLRVQEGYKLIWDCGSLKFSMRR